MATEQLRVAAKPNVPTAGRIAWVVWLVLVGLCGVAFLIQLSTESAWIPDAYGFPGFTSLFALSFGTVGAIVVSRRSSNVVGRVLLAAGAIAAFQSLYTEYAVAAYLVWAGSAPLAPIAAWLLSWAWLAFVYLGGPLLLSVFPDGRFLSRRWRLVAVLIGLDAALFAVLSAFRMGPLQNFAFIDNPFGVLAADVVDAVVDPVSAGLALGFVLPAASLVLRYRQSDMERRHQLKWIAAAGVLIGVAAPAGFTRTTIGQLAFIAAFCGIPVATGIAVLRYRLYEIDTIINRALVYGLLTAIIAGLYTASIGVMQRLSNEFLGGSSEATIVATTVLIVSAFTPIKARVQALVDRRFKGAADARSTLEAFTAGLRARTWPLEARLVLRRFADTVGVAVDAWRVDVSLELDGRPDLTASAVRGSQEAIDGATWSGASTSGPVTLGLVVALGRHSLRAGDEAALREALEAVAAELAAG